MKSLKPTFLDIFFDLFFLGLCLVVGITYSSSGQYLKGLAFGGVAVLTIWSLASGTRASAEIKKFDRHLLLRSIRMLIGGGLLLYLSLDLVSLHPFLAVGTIIAWLGITWHSSSRHDAIQAYRRKLNNPIRKNISTSPGQEFTASDLMPGKQYCVIKEFTDYHGTVHPIGESWQFMEKHFLPYDDGLTLHCARDEQEVRVYLQWRKETQGEIIDNFHTYVQEK
jgi:hypothetical protein